MSIVYNPFTGQLDFTGSGGGGGGSTTTVDRFTLNSGQISAKSVTLSASPTVASNVLFFVRNAPIQSYGTDYSVSGVTLTWNALGLDGVLEIGDEVTIVYQ